MNAVASKERAEKEEVHRIKEALEQQIDQHREQHQRQLATLRDEIADKQQTIEELKE